MYDGGNQVLGTRSFSDRSITFSGDPESRLEWRRVVVLGSFVAEKLPRASLEREEIDSTIRSMKESAIERGATYYARTLSSSTRTRTELNEPVINVMLANEGGRIDKFDVCIMAAIDAISTPPHSRDYHR